MFPCVKIVEWILTHTDVKRHVIKNVARFLVASFDPTTMSIYYKFPELEINLIDEWMQLIQLNCVTFIKQAWLLDNQF